MSASVSENPQHAHRAQRRRCAALWSVGLVIFAALTGCERSGTAGKPRPARDLNVLLISVDTTRADCLACYGHPGIETPNIDRLAAEGTLFEHCTTPVPLTLPAHTSLMTGTYPFRHGVRDNARFHVDARNATLAEALHDAGYVTAAQIGGYVLNREYGLDQGFDTYADVVTARRARLAAAGPAGSERKAEDVCHGAREWLRAHVDERFFLFVHFFDPHQPYVPPPRFARQYSNPYLGEIAYVDEQIGRLRATLDELGLTQRTLLVLTADHGEALNEHGEETHGLFVYDATLSIPLIFHCSDVVPAARRSDAQVRLVDVAPTVLALLRLPALPDADGVSLAPLISGAVTDLDLPAYAESFYPMFNMGQKSWQRAWRHDGWKYIHANPPELYHISADPHETRNLIAAEPQRAARMRDELHHLLAAARPVAGSAQHALAPPERRALESLGYIAAGDGDATITDELSMFDPPEPLAADLAEQNRLMSRAVNAAFAGDFPQAEATLHALIRHGQHDAGQRWVHKTLADVLLQQQKYAEAIAQYQQVIRIRPDDGEAYSNLGFALMRLGRTREAAATYAQALQHPPVFAETHHEYGLALAALGRRHEALEQQRAAVALDPQHVRACTEMGRLLTEMGRDEDAAAAFAHAIELAPRGAAPRCGYGEFLLGRGRAADARDEFERAVTLAPGSAEACCGLGRAYAALGQAGEALESLRKAVALDGSLAAAWLELGRVLMAERHYAEALDALRAGNRVAPRDVRVGNLLARLLAACPEDALRDGAQAERLARALERATGGTDVGVLDTLAAAQAERGQYGDALTTIDRAVSQANLLGQDALAAELRQRRTLYAAREPFRLPAP